MPKRFFKFIISVLTLGSAMAFGTNLFLSEGAQAQPVIGQVLPTNNDRIIDDGPIREDGASYYLGPRILKKIFSDYGKDISLDALTVDSETRYGISTYSGLKAALEKHGLYVQRKTLSIEEAQVESQKNTLLTRVSKNKIFSVILDVEENGVRLYSPFLHNKKYLMPKEAFLKSWDGDTLIISNKPFADKVTAFNVLNSDNSSQVVMASGGGGCGNVNGGGGPQQARPTKRGDPIIVNNGSLHVEEEDFLIPSAGFPLAINRYYNSQMFSEISGWMAEKGSGGWIVDNGVYHGHGDIAFTTRSVVNPTFAADIKTIMPGDSLIEVGGITFNYTDEHNRYFFRVTRHGSTTYLFLAKRKNDIQTWLVDGLVSPVAVDPQQWHTVRLVYNNGNIRIYLNNQLVINYTDPDPLPQGKVGLESHFSYSQFDNVSVSDAAGTDTYNFNQSGTEDYVMGHGWQFTYGMRIRETDAFVAVYWADGMISRYVKNPDGTFTAPALVYDQLSREGGGYRLSSKYGTVYRFNSSGGLVSIIDRNGNTTSLYYNANGRLGRVDDAEGRSLNFTYNAQGKIETIIDPASRVFRYTYDNEGNLASVTDPRNNTINYTYFPESHLLNTITDAENNTFTYTYLYNRRINQMFDPEGQAATLDYLWDTTVITKHNGESYSYHFDEANDRLLSETAPDGLMKRFSYYADENVNTATDRNNNTQSFIYDALGNVTSRTAKGHEGQDLVTRITYDPVYNQVQSIVDPKQRLTQFQLDSKGNVLKEIRPGANGEIVNTYYSNGLIKTRRDGNSKLWQYFYDENGYLQRVVDPTLKETLYDYDILGNLNSVTDARGNTIRYVYDDNNNMEKMISPAPFNYETVYEYNKNNMVTKVTNPDGGIIEYEYDSLNNLKTEKYYIRREGQSALLNTIRYTYDTSDYMSQGKILKKTVTDQNGHTTTFNYDNNYYLKEAINPLLQKKEYDYDNEGNLTAITDALAQKTSYTLSGTEALVTVITYPDNTTELFDYDDNGNLVLKTDREGNIIIYEYDELNRLKKEYDSDDPGYALYYTYDYEGNLLTARNSSGTVTYHYDELNRVKQIVYPQGQTVGYFYDEVGNTERIIYPDGSIVEYTYDQMNRLEYVIQDQEPLVRYEYDRASRVVKREYANGTEGVYGYDDVNRLLDVKNQWGEGNVFKRYQYGYDGAGNVLSVQALEGSSSFSYDKINQLISYKDYDGKTMAWDYDANGNRENVNEDGVNSAYGYTNAVNQIDSLVYNSGASPQKITVRGIFDEPNVDAIYVNGFASAVDGALQTFAAYNIPVISGYNSITAEIIDKNGLSNTTAINVEVDGPASFSFEYDLKGNLTHRNRGAESIVYEYDQKNRLIKVTDSESPAEPVVYRYDALGRRVEKQQGADSTRYFYDKDGQVIYETTLGTSVVWEEDFNPILSGWGGANGTWNCTIDGDGRVSVVSSSPESWGHVYSPVIDVNVDENPIVTVEIGEVSPGANVTLEIQAYWHDGGRSENFPGAINQTSPGIYQVDLRALMGWSGQHAFMIGVWVGGGAGRYVDLDRITVKSEASTQAVKYIYGPGTDNILMMQDTTGERYYYHHDRLGSVVAVSNTAGAVVETYKYDPYGKTRTFDINGNFVPESGINNPYMFTGRRLDKETGLYYYRARFYDPELGRFLQTDPLGYADGMNMYAYVGNNPVNFVDPWGLAGISSWSKLDPKVKGVITEAISFGIDKLAQNLPRGRLRGTLKVISGSMSLSSAYFFVAASGASFVLALTEPTIVAKPLAVATGFGAGAIAVYLADQAADYFREGFDEIRNPSGTLKGNKKNRR